MPDDTNPDDLNKAEDAVAESSGAYGGPASEEQLAEVYLPEGEQQAQTGSAASSSSDEDPQSEPGAVDEESSPAQ